MRDWEDRILGRLAPLLWEECRREWGINCCLPAAKIGHAVLDYHAIPHTVLPVRAILYTAPWQKALEEGHPRPLDVPGATAVGLGAPGPGETMEDVRPRHIILVGHDWLMDATLPQASRPAYAMVAEPLYVVGPPEPLAALVDMSADSLGITVAEGVGVMYNARNYDGYYTQAMRDVRAEHRAIIARLIRATKLN